MTPTSIFQSAHLCMYMCMWVYKQCSEPLHLEGSSNVPDASLLPAHRTWSPLVSPSLRNTHPITQLWRHHRSFSPSLSLANNHHFLTVSSISLKSVPSLLPSSCVLLTCPLYPGVFSPHTASSICLSFWLLATFYCLLTCLVILILCQTLVKKIS